MKGMRLPVGRRANEFVRWNLITVFVCGCACIYVSIIIVILPLCRRRRRRFDIKVMNHSKNNYVGQQAKRHFPFLARVSLQMCIDVNAPSRWETQWFRTYPVSTEVLKNLRVERQVQN